MDLITQNFAIQGMFWSFYFCRCVQFSVVAVLAIFFFAGFASFFVGEIIGKEFQLVARESSQFCLAFSLILQTTFNATFVVVVVAAATVRRRICS